jgi:hypothetical protein
MPMAGDLFIGVVQTLFFTVFAGFLIILMLGEDVPICDICCAMKVIFCGFLKTILFFFAKLIFESFCAGD